MNIFGHVQKELKDLNKRLERLHSDPNRTGPSHEEIKIVDRIVELSYREEIMWHQRSRIHWLREGDKNTRFFHLRASQRRRKNKIERLKKLDGQFTEDPAKLGNMITDFYKDLYCSEGTANMNDVLDTVPVKVMATMNDMLLESASRPLIMVLSD